MPTPAPPTPMTWRVKSGSCQESGSCMTSPNFPADYDSSSKCEIEISGSWVGAAIDVKQFDSENRWDFLYVNGQKYSGRRRNWDMYQGATPTENIRWTTDTYGVRSGWKICRTPAPTPGTTVQMPTPAPTPEMNTPAPTAVSGPAPPGSS